MQDQALLAESAGVDAAWMSGVNGMGSPLALAPCIARAAG
jgi:hypothetical protein